jgi:hypothetical protein
MLGMNAVREREKIMLGEVLFIAFSFLPSRSKERKDK